MWAEATRWHVYVLPDLGIDAEFRRLVEQSRTVMARHRALSVVPDAWLHATVQVITGRAGAAVTAAQRAALIAGLHEQVGPLAPFTATAGSVPTARERSRDPCGSRSGPAR
ncbi:hypothetical protein GCM10022255_085320 [Dactylosporangium darangshiense]|uniref:2'-5' RNA ligase n=2 Tax=Dactylosporangium darangshiense TaxID=579108 RepID=A0ABP8DMW4_9ACTN